MKDNNDIIKEVYQSINRDDIEAVLRLFDPEIKRIEPEDFPTAGTYRGHTEMKAHLIKGRSTWAEGGCYPQSFEGAGDKIVAKVHVHVRLKNETKWIDAYVFDGFAFKNGKITEMNSFTKYEQAMEWVRA